ncbi:sensor histidine kinase [Nonomuraea aurantiaca]|uniref:sensor histidine kinase n=1 Tax=Nonomuraea aurantiaca TaxID=2878562 RepID=UPI001CD9A9D9|nr:histidine kinase [Nonomuraea aurantiaca]MCA2221258.1 histidine kinase [Nonomuraea aurantiaca]
MDAIRRARRISLCVLNSMIVMTWVGVALATLGGLAMGTLSWLRIVPAMIALIVFTWLFLRITRAVLERRYLTREVVAAGALAVLAAALGGADPFGWGFGLLAWVSVALINIRVWAAVGLAVGTAVVGTGLGVVTLLMGQPLQSILVPYDDGAVFALGFVYAIMCALLPPSNRFWAWIYTLAVQAHEGREAHTRLAVAEERLRFARDLHDLVGHQLSAIAVKTELAVRLSAADTVAAKAEMVAVNTLTRTALRELRQAVRGYRELDLSAELNSVKGVLEAAGVRCELRLPYRDPPGGVAPVFAYAVREAATNVLKHSTASFCEITLRFTEEEAELSVRNDGVVRHQVSDVGSGLTGMGERLADIGGKVTARPTGDGEFLLRAVVSLPLRG